MRCRSFIPTLIRVSFLFNAGYINNTPKTCVPYCGVADTCDDATTTCVNTPGVGRHYECPCKTGLTKVNDDRCDSKSRSFDYSRLFFVFFVCGYLLVVSCTYTPQGCILSLVGPFLNFWIPQILRS